MSVLMCAGVGQLNSRVAKLWQSAENNVIGLRKSEPQADAPFEQLSLDLAAQHWPDVGAEYVVIALSALERTVEAYQQAYEQPIMRLIESMSQWRALPQKVVVVSSTRVYGTDQGRVIDDEFLAETEDEYGQILLTMEALVKQLPCEATVVRLSGIYGPGRDWLKRMAIKATLESLTGNHWTNRIHIDDAARAIVHILKLDTIAPHYLVSDLQPTPLVDMYNFFRQNERLELLSPAPEPDGGKRIVPSRLKASGFTWLYPDAFSGGYDN